MRQWKLSPTDLASLDKWDAYTEAKEAMFFYTDTADAPWTVIKSNDKKRARIDALRYVLHTLDYTDKDVEVVGVPDPLIVGPGRARSSSTASSPTGSSRPCRAAQAPCRAAQAGCAVIRRSDPVNSGWLRSAP